MHLTDFAHEIRIRQMWIVAGSITSLKQYPLHGLIKMPEH